MSEENNLPTREYSLPFGREHMAIFVLKGNRVVDCGIGQVTEYHFDKELDSNIKEKVAEELQENDTDDLVDDYLSIAESGSMRQTYWQYWKREYLDEKEMNIHFGHSWLPNSNDQTVLIMSVAEKTRHLGLYFMAQLRKTRDEEEDLPDQTAKDLHHMKHICQVAQNYVDGDSQPLIDYLQMRAHDNPDILKEDRIVKRVLKHFWGYQDNLYAKQQPRHQHE